MPADVVETVRWGHTGLTAVVEIHPDRPVALRELSAGAPPVLTARASQPLVEVLVPGEGRARASQRLSETAVGCRLRYAGSEQSGDGGWHELRVRMRDEVSGLAAELIMRSPDGVPAVRAQVRVTNTGEHTGAPAGGHLVRRGLPRKRDERPRRPVRRQRVARREPLDQAPARRPRPRPGPRASTASTARARSP
ncbi:hypothetical protein GCM10020220_097200 [Nonomuraea rubra]|uniref:hypothetical protein n=1 Tax=Nonomuraea rubra TaxID=46180 RepID=UPI0031E96BCF